MQSIQSGLIECVLQVNVKQVKSRRRLTAVTFGNETNEFVRVCTRTASTRLVCSSAGCVDLPVVKVLATLYPLPVAGLQNWTWSLPKFPNSGCTQPPLHINLFHPVESETRDGGWSDISLHTPPPLPPPIFSIITTIL